MVEAAGRRPAIAATEREAASGEPAATLLDLQARAGNAAVADLVAGSGPIVLREAVVAAGSAKRHPPSAKDGPMPAGGSMVIPDLELTIPLRAVMLANVRRSGNGASGGRSQAGAPTELVVVVDPGPAALALQQAAADGRTLGRVVVAHGFRLVLDEVVITSIHVSGAEHGEEAVSVGLAASRASTGD